MVWAFFEKYTQFVWIECICYFTKALYLDCRIVPKCILKQLVPTPNSFIFLVSPLSVIFFIMQRLLPKVTAGSYNYDEMDFLNYGKHLGGGASVAVDSTHPINLKQTIYKYQLKTSYIQNRVIYDNLYRYLIWLIFVIRHVAILKRYSDEVDRNIFLILWLAEGSFKMIKTL